MLKALLSRLKHAFGTALAHKAHWETWATFTFILLLAGRHRCFALDAMVNVDAFTNWARRTQAFLQGLGSGELGATYQSHHPGVMFMWLVGGLWKLFGIESANLTPFSLTLATVPVALIGTLFPVAVYGLLLRILGKEHRFTAAIAGVWLATEPMLMAHSRNAHLDMMVTAWSWVSVLAAMVALRSLARKWGIACGILLGMALLSKVSAAGFALGITLVCLVEWLRRPAQRREIFRQFCWIVGASILTVFALCPALWVSPVDVLARLWTGLNREVDGASPFMFLGRTGRLALPAGTYGAFALFLLTPEFLLPTLLGAGALLVRADRRRSLFVAITLATLPFAYLIVTSAHVGQRYLIPALPWFALASALVFGMLRDWVVAGSKVRLGLGLLCLTGLFYVRLARAERLQPLPITYCSKWTGIECSDLFHVGWGEGIKEAALYVDEHVVRGGPDKRVRLFGPGYAATMDVWTPTRRVKTLDEAEIVVDYLSDWQRQVPISKRIAEYIAERHLTPFHEVRLDGRTYVRLYAGPKFAGLKP